MKNPINQFVFFIGLLMLSPVALFSQFYNPNVNTVHTAVPFLLITPDARSAAMAGVGVSSSPDNYSLHSNPAKYAFIDKDLGFSLSFHRRCNLPVKSFRLPSATMFYKPDDKSAIAASFHYLSLGKVTFNDLAGHRQTYKPREYSISTAYSRKLSDHLSGAVAARYISSKIAASPLSSNGSSIAADLALFYNRNIEFLNTDAVLSWGVNISNIGTKISYYGNADFIPTNLNIGPGLAFNFNEQHSLAFHLDFNKLLVPTPPIYKTDSDGFPLPGVDGRWEIEKGRDPNVSVLRGMFQSFYDAPGGFSEEINEISLGFGSEYTIQLNDLEIAVRAGYHYQHESKGDRKHLSTGLGLNYKFVGLDFAYLFATPQSRYFYNGGWISLNIGFNTR
jgi:hypothetical protein